MQKKFIFLCYLIILSLLRYWSNRCHYRRCSCHCAHGCRSCICHVSHKRNWCTNYSWYQKIVGKYFCFFLISLWIFFSIKKKKKKLITLLRSNSTKNNTHSWINDYLHIALCRWSVVQHVELDRLIIRASRFILKINDSSLKNCISKIKFKITILTTPMTWVWAFGLTTAAVAGALEGLNIFVIKRNNKQH